MFCKYTGYLLITKKGDGKNDEGGGVEGGDGTQITQIRQMTTD